MATLQEAIDYSRKNPQSDFARLLKQRIQSGEADSDFAKEGIDPTQFGRPVATQTIPTEEKQGYLGRVKKTMETAAGKVGESFGSGAEQLQQDWSTYSENIQDKTPVEKLLHGFVFLSNVAGNVASTAATVGTRSVQAGLSPISQIETPEGDTIGKRFSEPITQSVESGVKTLIEKNPYILKKLEENPELVRQGMNLLSTLGLVGGGKVLGAEVPGIKATTGAIKEAAQDVISTTAKLPGQAVTAVKSIPSKTVGAAQNTYQGAKNVLAKTLYGDDAEKLQASLKTSYDKVPLPKAIIQEEANTGKSFSQFMSEKPYLSMDVKDSKWNTFNTAQSLREEVKPEAKALANLLESRQEMISQESIIQQIKEAAKSIATGQEQEGMLSWVETEIPTLVKQLAKNPAKGPDGEIMVRVADWNRIKQALWERSPFKPTASRQDNLRSSVDYKMGQIVRNNIENAIEDVDIRQLNSQLGDYYHAISVLESLHGGAAPGGRLGGAFAKLSGAVVGSPGGVIGSFAGYMTAEQISTLLMNPAITTAIKREALQALKEQRPTVAKQVADILEKQAAVRVDTKALPEPSFIPMGEYKGGGGTTQQVKAPAAQKGPTGFDPKSGKFKSTYTSTADEDIQQNIHTYIDILK